jgi:hypothetical protein
VERSQRLRQKMENNLVDVEERLHQLGMSVVDYDLLSVCLLWIALTMDCFNHLTSTCIPFSYNHCINK